MSKSKASREREAARVSRQLAKAPASSRPKPAKLGFESSTPIEPLSKQVRSLCSGLSAADPVFLPFTDFGLYRAKQCHVNVYHRVREHGGERVNGWMIWENALFADAEFHCVWRSPNGELLDITPRSDGEATILFLPDPVVRLTRSPRGLWMPNNRTTLPMSRYVMGGLPCPNPVAENGLDQATRDYCASLGVEPFAICE